ncbi:single-stranded DNA-binding protein [Changpingibacter yushuensis]|uniref:single-stranded DNA-binding protein n=1 Tax=Changpingibacter yushuensis TaxID=2758440 RepID=UPI00165E4F58|nr:single-stranded DNA-binding protein [Changpingibacter yushuensis]
MSNETFLTIRGFAGADPTVFHNESGRVTVVIRVGVTARNFDRRLNTYSDGTTAWYSVRCYGDLAENVSRSIHKGSPVLIRGRLSPRTWTDKDGRTRTDYAIAADSVAIDLNTGWATFVRTRKQSLEPIEGEPAHSASADDEAPPPSLDAMRGEEIAEPVEPELEESAAGVLQALA